MELAANLPSPNQINKLLRLYLAWPNRFESSAEEDAEVFYLWLKQKYADLSVVRALTSAADVANFLAINPEIIEAARYLKPTKDKDLSAVRKEKRIGISTNVVMGVYDCYPDPSLIGLSLKGSVTDVTPTGIGVVVHEAIPKTTILNLTVAVSGQPITLYRLTGEVRWVDPLDHTTQLGISIFNLDDAGKWQRDFDSRFMGRS